MSNIASVPSHISGDAFSQGMWASLQQNINDGIVNQVCAARVYNTGNFATTAGGVILPFNSERYDGDSMHDPADNTKLTCKTAGIYRIGGHIEFPADSGSNRAHLMIRVNGTLEIARQSLGLFTAGPGYISVVTEWLMGVGDYAELKASSVSALSVQADADFSPEFYMSRV